MNLLDLINRKPNPEPWAEGDNIPWNEPAFSERMLAEHLSQDHHAASRKFDLIDRHIHWIHHYILMESPSRVLDLGCGPGLYTSRLAKLGHQCVGIDYSPASIVFARETAVHQKLDCKYIESDLRDTNFGSDFNAAMLINGEFNIFRPSDIRLILIKIHQALKSGGRLILEPHTFKAVQSLGERTPSWYASKGGLFSPNPHIVMEEYFWDSHLSTTSIRYYVIEADTSEVTLHAQSFQAYSQEEYKTKLQEYGYTNISFYPSLTGVPDLEQPNLLAILSTKP